MEISLQPHFRGAEGVTHVKIEGTMGLDSLDFYPKSEVLCRLGRKSRGVKSITTYRWSRTLNLSLAIRSFQFFISVGREEKKRKKERRKSSRTQLEKRASPPQRFELISYDFCAPPTRDLIRFGIRSFCDRFFFTRHLSWSLQDFLKIFPIISLNKVRAD